MTNSSDGPVSPTPLPGQLAAPPTGDHPAGVVLTWHPTEKLTWCVCLDGRNVVQLVITAAGGGGVSVDVQPTGPSTVQAIAFGAPATHLHQGRPVTIPLADRFVLGEANGQLVETAQPFVCVEVMPESAPEADDISGDEMLHRWADDIRARDAATAPPPAPEPPSAGWGQAVLDEVAAELSTPEAAAVLAEQCKPKKKKRARQVDAHVRARRRLIQRITDRHYDWKGGRANRSHHDEQAAAAGALAAYRWTSFHEGVQTKLVPAWCIHQMMCAMRDHYPAAVSS